MLFRLPPSRLREVDARRICIVKPSALGDVVQALPLLGALRSRFPSASVSWIIRRDLADLLTGDPELSELIPYRRDGSAREFLQLLELLRRRRFDLVFDLQGLFRTALMTVATRATVRVGLETAREGASLACNCIIPDSSRNVPAHLRYWRVAEALGAGGRSRVAVVPVTAEATSWAAEALRPLPRPILAIHPGATWETKRWPAAKFAELASRFDGSVVVVGSDQERKGGAQIANAVLAQGRSAVDLTGQTTLKRLAALLAAADLLVSNDSGPLHLAAALGTPVVGIFTCTSPVRSGPAGELHELISTGVPCAGSYKKTCPFRGPAHLACLGELSVERVWVAVERIVDGRKLARPA
jgi:lipopolysaccharide heptosyltransferase II